MSFGKIFESTFTGSMAGAGPNVFAVWAYVIANAKPPGVVELNPIILSAVIGSPVNDINDAISFLCEPDERSRTKEHDGRRLLKICEFTFSVPTWAKYRSSRNDEDRRAYNAEAQRKHRAKKKASTQMSLTSKHSKPPSAQAEAEAEALNTPPNPQRGNGETSRKRDPLFDAIATECGINLNEIGTNKSVGGMIAKAKKDILGSSPGATAEDIKARSSAYRRKMPGILISPPALAKHWPSLGTATEAKDALL